GGPGERRGAGGREPPARAGRGKLMEHGKANPENEVGESPRTRACAAPSSRRRGHDAGRRAHDALMRGDA
ncbi:hypothetical protein FG484_30590, partial [Burkholderia pseudomallei]|nr:hypothetical protein [Burkholderia pseudomallei]